MSESNSPLQLDSGDHRRVHTITYGGPSAGLDTRMFVTGDMLADLKKVVDQSLVGMATLPCVGLQIDIYEKPDGSKYEVWQFISRPPVPSKSLRG